MKNTIDDLNNALFAEIENLQDEDLDKNDLERVIRRAKAVSEVADVIVRNGELALKTMEYMSEYGYATKDEHHMPRLLDTGK